MNFDFIYRFFVLLIVFSSAISLAILAGIVTLLVLWLT